MHTQIGVEIVRTIILCFRNRGDFAFCDLFLFWSLKTMFSYFIISKIDINKQKDLLDEELCRRGSDKDKSQNYESQTPSPILHFCCLREVFKEDEVML